MNKKTFVWQSLVVVATSVIVGCGTKQYPLYAPGENLSALSKVTEGEDRCEYPYGGDNGRNLFFTVTGKHGSYTNIYKKEDPFSASMSQKTSGKNHYSTPSYCAATGRVAFSGRQESAPFSDLYMIDASQGGALTAVTSTPDYSERHPCLSSDGHYIVYERVSALGKLGDCEIWRKNLQTNENQTLAVGRMPSFSPDGRFIAYVQYASDGSNTCLWVMDSNGSNKVQVTRSDLGVVANPRFSPDGQRIVFQCSRKQKTDFDLYVIDRNGNNMEQLTVNKAYDGEPYWANDGNIYFTSDRGGRMKLYQIWRFKFGSTVPPVPSPYVNPTPTPTPTPTPGPTHTYHTVRQGETIKQVADMYGVTVRNIVKWNGLSTMTLTPGMRLQVSGQ